MRGGRLIAVYHKPKAPTQPPQKPMSARRVSVPNQIKLLISGAMLAGPRFKSFSINDAAKNAGVAGGQARYVTRFFIAAGLWVGMGNGVYTTTRQGREFGILWEPTRDKARWCLNGQFKTMWFHETLCRELTDGPVRVEDLEAALLVDGGGLQEHIKLIKHLMEWMSIAYLIEQTQDGKVKAGLGLFVDASQAKQSAPAEPAVEGLDHDADPLGAQPEGSEEEFAAVNEQSSVKTNGTVPGPRRPNFMAELVVEAIVALSPDEIPAFMKALGVISRTSTSSVLFRQ